MTERRGAPVVHVPWLERHDAADVFVAAFHEHGEAELAATDRGPTIARFPSRPLAVRTSASDSAHVNSTRSRVTSSVGLTGCASAAPASRARSAIPVPTGRTRPR